MSGQSRDGAHTQGKVSRIDELIARLCPDGVEFKTLGEVATYSQTRINASILDETTFVGVDNLLPNMAGKTNATYTANTARLTGYEVGDILLGNIRPYLKKIWLANNNGGCSGDVLAIRIIEKNRPKLMPEFLYRLLASEKFFTYSMQYAKGAKMPRGSKEAILKYRIPIPPLEVQREIVKVLDTFTQLEAELEAELEARRRQYQYYRDALLRFDERPAAQASIVRWKAMAEVAEIRSGWGFPQRYQGYSSGIYPFYKVSDMNISGNEIMMMTASNFIDDVTAKKLGVTPAPAGTVIFPKIGAAIATNKKRLLSIPSAYDNNIMGLIPNKELSPRFLLFWMQTVDLTKLAHDSGAVPSIRKSEMEKLLIPVPPLEEQERIVAILDRFDALVNDLTFGLPAEIQARRRQYAHYRDRLLTFREAPPAGETR